MTCSHKKRQKRSYRKLTIIITTKCLNIFNWKLKDEVFRKRQKPIVLRYHSFKIDTEIHEYMYSELLLFSPWKDETELKADSFDEVGSNELTSVT
jgi:ribosomal protein L32